MQRLVSSTQDIAIYTVAMEETLFGLSGLRALPENLSVLEIELRVPPGRCRAVTLRDMYEPDPHQVALTHQQAGFGNVGTVDGLSIWRTTVRCTAVGDCTSLAKTPRNLAQEAHFPEVFGS